eukprot:COSAG02_NODE_13793_length_1347_cov_1.046474_2_plen_73_part_01
MKYNSRLCMHITSSLVVGAVERALRVIIAEPQSRSNLVIQRLVKYTICPGRNPLFAACVVGICARIKLVRRVK